MAEDGSPLARRVTITDPSFDSDLLSDDATEVVSLFAASPRAPPSPAVSAPRFRPPDLLAQLSETEFGALALRLQGHPIHRDELIAALQPVLAGKYDLPPEEVAEQLVEVFKVVNTRGGEAITWEELTNYLIDTAIHGRPNVDSHDAVLEYHAISEIELYTGVDDALRRARPLRGLNRVAGCMRSKKVKLLDPAAGFKVTHEVTIPRGAFALDAAYLPPNKSLLVSTSDLKLCVFSQATTLEREWVLRWERPLECSQTCVKWAPRQRRAFTGSRTGDITAWQLLGERGKRDFELGVDGTAAAAHSEAVMDVLLFQDDTRLASCSLDGSVAMRDLQRGLQAVQEFKGNCMGLYSLAHSDDYRVVVAAGFEYHPYVWVDSQLSLPPVRLQDTSSPHLASLLGVLVVPGTPQLISCDAKGICKVWDLRKMACVQSFHVPDHHRAKEVSPMYSFCYVHGTKQLLFNGARSYIYEYDGKAQSEPRHAHDTGSALVLAVYNPFESAFLTAAGKGVKTWDAATGQVQAFFKRLVDSDITSACVDDTGRKLVVGTQDGHVVTRHFATGQAVGHYQRHPHDGEITNVAYCPGLHYIVSTSETGWLCVWTDIDAQTKGNRSLPLKAMELKSRPTCMAFSLELSLLLVGDTNHTVQCFLLDDKPRENTLPTVHKCERHDGEIVALELLAPYPAFVCSDGSGLTLWTVRPYPYRDMRLARWENCRRFAPSLPRVKSRAVTFTPAVTAICWHPPHTIFTGDESGHVAHWSIADIVAECHLSEASMRDAAAGVQARPTFPRPRLRDRVRCVKTWQAHARETIISLQFVAPHFVLTAAFDNYVFVWNVAGPTAVRCASLEQGRSLHAAKASPWDFAPLSRFERAASDAPLQDAVCESPLHGRLSTVLSTARSPLLPTDSAPDIQVSSSAQETSTRRRRLLPGFASAGSNVSAGTSNPLATERSQTDSGSGAGPAPAPRGAAPDDSGSECSDVVSEDFANPSRGGAAAHTQPKFTNFRLAPQRGPAHLAQVPLHVPPSGRVVPLHQVLHPGRQPPQQHHQPPAAGATGPAPASGTAGARASASASASTLPAMGGASHDHADALDYGDELGRVSTLFELLMTSGSSNRNSQILGSLRVKAQPLSRKLADLDAADPAAGADGEAARSRARRRRVTTRLLDQQLDDAIEAARELTNANSKLVGMAQRFSVYSAAVAPAPEAGPAVGPLPRPARPASASPALRSASASASVCSSLASDRSARPGAVRAKSCLPSRKRLPLTDLHTGFACKSRITREAVAAATAPSSGAPPVLPGKGGSHTLQLRAPPPEPPSFPDLSALADLQEWLAADPPVPRATRQHLTAGRIEPTR